MLGCVGEGRLVAQPLQGTHFGRITCYRFKRDAGLKDASEIGDAEQEHEQKREHEGKLHHPIGRGASAWRVAESVEIRLDPTWCGHDVGRSRRPGPGGDRGPLESARLLPV